MSSTARYGPGDIRPGDWIKYRSEYYGCGRLAEVHGLGEDAHSGAFAVTTEGRVLLGRILEVRRRPLNVLVFPSAPGAAEPAGSCSEPSGRGEGEGKQGG